MERPERHVEEDLADALAAHARIDAEGAEAVGRVVVGPDLGKAHDLPVLNAHERRVPGKAARRGFAHRARPVRRERALGHPKERPQGGGGEGAEGIPLPLQGAAQRLYVVRHRKARKAAVHGRNLLDGEVSAALEQGGSLRVAAQVHARPEIARGVGRDLKARAAAGLDEGLGRIEQRRADAAPTRPGEDAECGDPAGGIVETRSGTHRHAPHQAQGEADGPFLPPARATRRPSCS